MKEYAILCESKQQVDNVNKKAVQLGYKENDYSIDPSEIFVMYLEENGSNQFNTYDDVKEAKKDIEYNESMITAAQFLGDKKIKERTCIVTYDIRGCGDPTEWFETLLEAKKRALELAQNEDNINIRFGEMKSINEVIPSFKIKKIK